MFVNLIPLLSLSGSVFVRIQGLKGEGGNTTCCGARCFPRAFHPVRGEEAESIPSLQQRAHAGMAHLLRFSLKASPRPGKCWIAVEFFPSATLKGWREPAAPDLAGAEAKQTPTRPC